MTEVSQNVPCDATELVYFRHRKGEQGMELLFIESIIINGADKNDPHVSIGTTVHDKIITFPTDDKPFIQVINDTFVANYCGNRWRNEL